MTGELLKGRKPYVVAEPDAQTDPHAELDAHWRAMPVQRLLDGGVLYGDVLRLRAATDEGAGWDETLEHLGEVQLDRGREASARGNDLTAIRAYRAAAADFLFAQMPVPDGRRKRGLYAQARAAFTAITEIPGSGLSRVEASFGDGALVGWLRTPVDPLASVIVFGGQSGWGATYYRMSDALAARGIATLMAEGPGQGESRLVSGIHLDGDVPAAFSRFVDVLDTHPDLAGAPIGIWGNSLGGTFAALTAAADHRITATVVNGGFAMPRLLPFRTFREQAAAMLGSDDEAALEANFARLAVDPRSQTIAGSLLVVHGGADPIVEKDDQTPFLDACDDALLVEWPGGDHTIYNDSDERTDVVADWLADRLVQPVSGDE